MFRIDRPIAHVNSSLVLYRVPHFGEEIVIAWPHIGCVRWMFQNLPLQVAQDFRDRSSGVTLCIVVKNDDVLYHQDSQSLKTFLCTTISCHFNFDLGTLLQFFKHDLRAFALSLSKSTFYILQYIDRVLSPLAALTHLTVFVHVHTAGSSRTDHRHVAVLYIQPFYIIKIML